MTAAIAISDAMGSELLFGEWFAGESWDLWKIVAKAVNGERLTPRELERFKEVAGDREPPKEPVRELVAIVGRGGGKDAFASALMAIEAATYRPVGRRPGERVVVMTIAVDKAQAKIAFDYTKGLFEATPSLNALVSYMGNGSISLRNGVDIEVYANDFRSVRGRSILAVCLDECAFYSGSDSANPDTELVAALSPSLGRVPGSRLIMISSAFKKSGLLYEKWLSAFGKDDPSTLVVKGATQQFNPSFPQETIDRDVASDPARFRAEYFSEWRDDISNFISRDLLDAAVDNGVISRPVQDGVAYFAACDPSGGRHDSFTVAIAHAEKGGTIVQDIMAEYKPPLSPSTVIETIAGLLRIYRCDSIAGDNYAAQFVVDAFAQRGIRYIHSERNKSEVFVDVLPLFTSGGVSILDDKKMISEFANLERRVHPSGRDKIDHPANGHDDLANACAMALTLAARRPFKEAPIVCPIVISQPRDPGMFSSMFEPTPNFDNHRY